MLTPRLESQLKALTGIRPAIERLRNNGLEIEATLFHFSGNLNELKRCQEYIDRLNQNNISYSFVQSKYGTMNRIVVLRLKNGERPNDWNQLAEEAGQCIRDITGLSGISTETVSASNSLARWLYALFDLAWSVQPGFPMQAKKYTFATSEIPFVLKSIFENNVDQAIEQTEELESKGFRSTLNDVVRASLNAIDLLTEGVEPEPAQQAAPLAVTEVVNLVDQPAEDEQDSQFIFADTGGHFYLQGFGESGSVNKLKGFKQIRKILMADNPSEGVSCFDLAEFNDGQQGCQAMTDPQGVREAKNKLAELGEERTEADRNNDLAWKARIDNEDKDIRDYLNSTTGKNGKPRIMGSEQAKARSAVSQTIARVVTKLHDNSMNEIANHFEAGISCLDGHYSYQPAGNEIIWKFSQKLK